MKDTIQLLKERKKELEKEIQIINDSIDRLKNMSSVPELHKRNFFSDKYLKLKEFLDKQGKPVHISLLIDEFVSKQKIFKNRFTLNTALHQLKVENQIKHVRTGTYSTNILQQSNKISSKRETIFTELDFKKPISVDELYSKLVGQGKPFKTKNALRCALYGLSKIGKINRTSQGEYTK